MANERDIQWMPKLYCEVLDHDTALALKVYGGLLRARNEGMREALRMVERIGAGLTDRSPSKAAIEAVAKAIRDSAEFSETGSQVLLDDAAADAQRFGLLKLPPIPTG